jgi:glycosyltransferase involved in cell wall biosynthesis
MLLRAFRQVLERVDARLIILGEGPLRGELEALAFDLGIGEKVHFSGFRVNPMPLFRRAAAVVVSSSYEGFGNVLVEAMACGTPVISTDCPVGPREILEDGRLGMLVPVGDDAALAAAMLVALKQPADPQQLREAARRFHARRISLLYHALFERLATGGARTGTDLC